MSQDALQLCGCSLQLLLRFLTSFAHSKVAQLSEVETLLSKFLRDTSFSDFDANPACEVQRNIVIAMQ